MNRRQPAPQPAPIVPPPQGAPLWTAVALADALGDQHRPTAEQARVIEADLTPVICVAGAGSGKTRTMARRVVWLVANGFVRPEQVLGLTFARAAAAELGEEIARGLAKLAALQRSDRGRRSEQPPEGQCGEAIALLDGQPTVATYHAYAARLAGEWAALEGRSIDGMLTEAAAYQVADRVVRRYDGDVGGSTDVGTIVAQVRELADQIGEHLLSEEDVRRFAAQFDAECRGKSAEGRVKQPSKTLLSYLYRQQQRVRLLPLVAAFGEAKARAGRIGFTDSLEIGARLAEAYPRVGEAERARFRAVLLDEYQDTSWSQARLLGALFAGQAVTAVGDPRQAIYGWRGASPGAIGRFTGVFAGGLVPRRHHLSTSFRNGAAVLTCANRLAEDLLEAGAKPVPLTANPAREDPGEVRLGWFATKDDEVRAVVERIRAELDGGRPLSEIAVLSRTRDGLVPVADALREAGVPVQLVGLGGLLSTPEVADVVATLRLLADPGAGDAAMRILTGARWRIGPRDLVALARRARVLARPAGASSGGNARTDVAVLDEMEPDQVDEASIVEALDHLGPPEAYTPEGYRRLVRLGAELRALRDAVGRPLPDLVAEVEHVLHLDVELAAVPGQSGGTRRHLDRFVEEASAFSEAADDATLTGFLSYVRAAEEAERGFAAGRPAAGEDAVQLMTVHAAKGLEWDVVAVVGMVEGRRGSSTWLTAPEVLPYPLRGDAAELPELDVTGQATFTELNREIKRFLGEQQKHDLREERRLTYVAVTRARSVLLCTGAMWRPGRKTPDRPSRFLEELRDVCDKAGLGEPLAWAAKDHPRPDDERDQELTWPGPHLTADRAAVLEQAARWVRAARATGTYGEPAGAAVGGRPATRVAEAGGAPALLSAAPGADASGVPGDGSGPSERVRRWDADLEVLLAERAAAADRQVAEAVVVLPPQVSATMLVGLHRDPEAVAAEVRRPLPRRPDPAARRGTRFHAWVEQYLSPGAARLFDQDDPPGADAGDVESDAQLAALKRRFLDSEWGARTAHDVEVPFQVVIAGHIVRGRMDAVFRREGGRFDVVDWKTGRPPTGRAERSAEVQLAVYRLAWAQLEGIDPSRVSAAFHYVRDGVTRRHDHLLDAQGLERLILDLPLLTAGDAMSS